MEALPHLVLLCFAFSSNPSPSFTGMRSNASPRKGAPLCSSPHSQILLEFHGWIAALWFIAWRNDSFMTPAFPRRDHSAGLCSARIFIPPIRLLKFSLSRILSNVSASMHPGVHGIGRTFFWAPGTRPNSTCLFQACHSLGWESKAGTGWVSSRKPGSGQKGGAPEQRGQAAESKQCSCL